MHDNNTVILIKGTPETPQAEIRVWSSRWRERSFRTRFHGLTPWWAALLLHA